MPRLLHSRHGRSWQQTASFVRYATRVFSANKICNCIAEAITCHGSWSRRTPRKRLGARCTFVPNRAVCTMTRHVHLATWQELRNTSVESMARRNGSARNAPKGMLSSLIGRPTLKPAGPASIAVTVALYSPGTVMIKFYFWCNPIWHWLILGVLPVS